MAAKGFEQDPLNPGQPGLGSGRQDFPGQSFPARRIEMGAGFIEQEKGCLAALLTQRPGLGQGEGCLLYTSDAADE